MNFNEGRQYFPSSTAQNYIDQMRLSRVDPIKNYTADQTVSTIGSVRTPMANQTVQGGVNMINPQISGPMREITCIPKTNRVLTKYENKRRGTQVSEGLYDLRSGVSMNNEGKVSPNWYLNSLQEKAKSKVMNRPSVDYRTQYEQTMQFDIGDVAGRTNNPTAPPETFNAQGFDTEHGVMNFSKMIKSEEVQIPSYNPLLQTTNQNMSRYGNSNYPDERMTHYSGERPFMTKGDRIMAARELATSDYNKERRELQNQAHNALKGVVRNPRQIGASFGQGINTDVKTDVAHTNMTGRAELDMNEDFRMRREEFVGRQTDLNRRQSINQAVKTYYQPGIEKINRDVAKHDIRRKIHNDNGETSNVGIFRSVIEGFKTFFWNDDSKDAVHDRSSVKVKNERFETIDREDLREGLKQKSILDSFKSLFEKNPNLHIQKDGKREYMPNNQYENELVQDRQLNERLQELKIRPVGRNLYHVVERGVKTVYASDTSSKLDSITKPVSILTLDGNSIIRSVATRNSNTISVLQRRDKIETGEIKYVVATIPLALVEDKLRKKLTDSNSRFKDDLLTLSYDDHIKLTLMIETMPDKMKYETIKPVHYHQRDILNDPHQDYVTNVEFEQGEVRTKDVKQSRLKGGFEDDGAYCARGTQHTTYDPRSSDLIQPDRIKTDTLATNQKDSRVAMKRFNNMM